MTITLQQLVKDKKEELVGLLCRRLKASSALHYKRVNQEVLRGRVERLVEQFMRSLRGDPRLFVSHVEKITEERIAEGYYLQEIQLALNALEERMWQLATEHSNIAVLLPNLSLITATIGQAKDRLAQIYLDHKARGDAHVAQLERRCEELFKGTERFSAD